MAIEPTDDFQRETPLRALLRANLFDGDEGGSTTWPIKGLLDEICEVVGLWLVEQTCGHDYATSYYGESEKGD